MARRAPAFNGLRVGERHIAAHRYHPDSSIRDRNAESTEKMHPSKGEEVLCNFLNAKIFLEEFAG